MREPLRQQRREHAAVISRTSIAGGGIALSIVVSTWWSTALAVPATVLSVGDGDTLTVNGGGRRTTIRLACIDAPESLQRPYGGQSRAVLQALAQVGATVTVQGNKQDRYGRTVAEILRGSTNVNLELVRRGDAFVYRQYLSGCDRNAYLSAEKQAESASRGVWSVSGGITRPSGLPKSVIKPCPDAPSRHPVPAFL